MAVELTSFTKMEDQMALQEAASQGLKSMENLIRLMSHQSNRADCTDLADLTVSKFKKVISLLNRKGHARFRRGPVQPSSSFSSPSFSSPPSGSATRSQTLTLTPSYHAAAATVQNPAPVAHQVTAPHVQIAAPASFVQSQPQSLTLDFTKANIFSSNSKSTELEFNKESFSSSSSLMSSAITGERIVSNGKQRSSIFLALVGNE